ncbi:hypothetical protein OIE62_26010 [Streptomyces scopuliridis]|uniref:Uncharacterized protein n=2 Tax=Streptomyces scopuliridis TaxID=452529 RepID=A0A2T7SN12_9ACTN|nr:hypothetical protein [Streptomyces scopuliridis]PVE04206.1 hypothetical protein Y717_13305 [Streptomyces scopuliridis RB72]WSB98189.1 hypothetical protein OG835_14930 [Streptomyces scopuliridis]WSC08109.1 hypothetical protein OIE62_26010 [Streptomyces scopuliridis]
MTEPNPYADGEYKWGPTPGTPPAGTPGAAGSPGVPEYDFPNPTLADGAPGATAGYGYPGAAPAPGYGYPQSGAAYPVPAGAAGTPLVSIGDITVVGDSIITPSGTLPLRGAVWNATDMSRTEEKIPTHAIILAIVFFIFCLLGLLFLLMKEKTTTGFIQVTVTSGGKHHSTMIPANHAGTFQMVMGQISYARSLSAM